jgi:uncharacterized protein (TIGR01244 family)
MRLHLQPIDERVAVSGQLAPEDMKDVAGAGYFAVVNNRPDREAMFGQPRTDALKAAAEEAGLVFVDLPFSGPNLLPDQVRAFRDLLAKHDGRVLAFCKSGMRSALLWGVASMVSGKSLNEVLDAARKAGQNLDPAGDMMTALAAQAGG